MAVKACYLTAFTEYGGLSEAVYRLPFRGFSSCRERGRPEIFGDYYGARAGYIHEFQTYGFIPGNGKEYKKYNNNREKEAS